MNRILVAAVLLCASAAASADMLEHAHRSQTGGVDLIAYKTGVKDVVFILGALPAGDAFAGGGNAAIPTLTGMMLDRGTTTKDKFAIAAQLDGVGAEIAFDVGVQAVQIRAKCLKKDLPLVIALIAEELRKPALSHQEFAKAKQQFKGVLESSLQSTDMRAQEAFSRAVFPEGHPNHPHSIEEFLAALKSATLEDVKTFHAAYYGPAHFTLVLVGDVDMAQAQSAVGSAFAGWTGGRDYLRPPVTALPPAQPEIVVPLADKTSVTVFLGQSTGLRYRDPGALALRVGTAILGNGFTGRLMHNVRDKQGLTYSIGAAVTGDNFAQGAWEISASFAPALLDKGIAAAREQLQNWWAEGVSDAELEERRQGIVGSYFVGLSTTAGIGSAVLSATQRGLGLSWLDEYPQAVKALTRAQINDAIKAHLNPSAMVLVKAGSVAAAAH